MAWLTEDEMKKRIKDCLSPWAYRVFLNTPPATGPVPAEQNATFITFKGAMEEQHLYMKTPGHPDGLSESEIQRCVAAGVRDAQAMFYGIKSPIDRPGLPGPMKFGEFAARVVTAVEGQREFSGAAPEPHYPSGAPATGGGGGWSTPWD